MKRKKLITDKEQTTGELPVPKATKTSRTIRTLAELVNGTAKRFPYATEDEFRASLSATSLIDLQHKCADFGVTPRNNRVAMIDNLMKEYRRDEALFKTSKDFDSEEDLIPSDKLISQLKSLGGNRLA